jgi:gas vesicle protein
VIAFYFFIAGIVLGGVIGFVFGIDFARSGRG